MFLGGSVWAMVVIEGLWRGDVSRPARQAVSAVFARLSDMAFDIASGEVGEADQQAVHYSQHRRAVRAAIERAEMQVANGQGHGAMIARRALVSADEVFHALLALDHRRSGDPTVWVDLRDIGDRLAGIARQLRRGSAVQPQDAIAVRHGSASEAGAFRAIDSALEAMTGGRGTATAYEAPVPTPAADGHRLKRTVLHALRIAAVVAIVTATAHALGLGYPYWAAMAVIVVLHPVRRMSVARGVERILGSVAGGAVASLLLPWLEAPAVVAGLVLGGTLATIALRSVNYTIFVAFLSVIFVLVMHMLHPAEGLAGMRILDNVVGSVAAIASVLVFSPRGGPSLATRIAEAVAANRAYLEAIESEDPAKVTSARRAAGLASIEAEMAAHMPGHIFGAAISTQEAQGLAEARRLAGEAAARWHDKVRGQSIF
ncbi:FUSC family protein [Novosphingobium sp. 9]|uniref:FUSC family protein n=1 Tax=Novosphingobium sp. 9 TaxID=2025349 RepID=UPI0021B5226A|nr:FUSC family protein [Novosphingobium sp. 9]